ncbi:GH92 family glycosyl hydrolase [Mangrovibacterium diazotrophicum]|uniref:Putative alpha-1,2-mannosidase n=1 Tax=Mangrovibacterium diazotrophicum TaxID=1261403 RepID=A0A419VYP8_9BACT|nr:GH92 family glycosyl hydrolase [Mangrovibacterium diazotrophicum]RKD88279.1 putative alpha-1,2-mannosidase [Mangrovibacterium diazotrophicum]
MNLVSRNMLALIGSIFLLGLFSNERSFAQTSGNAAWVNPFIGTADSDTKTNWGTAGGTYPGAVYPWGRVQLTPETGIGANRGYHYTDSVIYQFSCVNHYSGYPEGSGGNVFFMPSNSSLPGDSMGLVGRPFSHKNEQATPGFYRVVLDDDGTELEMTTNARSGMVRFRFPEGVAPKIYIGGAGKINVEGTEVKAEAWNSLFRFLQKIASSESVSDGVLVSFKASKKSETIIEMKYCCSSVSWEGANKNMESELPGWDFEQFRLNAEKAWNESLSVVQVDDERKTEKTIFYTALYHSLLMPWIISDIDGFYRGADGKVYQTKGSNQYGAFSPWDTYRSLHPLLCLLCPQVQQDIVRSMLDVYQQAGHLPSDPMTGNHAIAVLADSYAKGIDSVDPAEALVAIEKTLDYFAARTPDFQFYRERGYVSADFPESVTRTVEYTYDDWAAGHFLSTVYPDSTNNRFSNAAENYRNLIDLESLFILPRKGEDFIKHPGNQGYKEGDKWVYSYGVQQDPWGLINYLGGSEFFVTRLDSALSAGQILFDNETMLHIPYYFNYTPYPEKTQYLVNRIRNERYLNTPGGIPGNDDLGSMSSWYVFSALGFYPFCPGEPNYSVVAPLFAKAIVHLPNGKTLTIRKEGKDIDNCYLVEVLLNGDQQTVPQLSHAQLVAGGELTFKCSAEPVNAFSDLLYRDKSPEFKIHAASVSKRQVSPDEEFWLRYGLSNSGSSGTKFFYLQLNGNPLKSGHAFIPANSVVADSIAIRLYKPGKVSLTIDGEFTQSVEVLKDKSIPENPYRISELQSNVLVPVGDSLSFSFQVQNITGQLQSKPIEVSADCRVVTQISVKLEPGEITKLSAKIKPEAVGIHHLQIGNQQVAFKQVEKVTEALVLELDATKKGGEEVTDLSGFSNTVLHPGIGVDADFFQVGTQSHLEIPASKSMQVEDKSMTMSVWVYPENHDQQSQDIFCQADFNVLQIQGGAYLNFFAGGWGRGECRAALTENWVGKWHHLVGVCDDEELRLYVDGQLVASQKVAHVPSLADESNWTVGRNVEFPGTRIFSGKVDLVRLYQAPLSAEDIQQQFANDRERFQMNK